MSKNKDCPVCSLKLKDADVKIDSRPLEDIFSFICKQCGPFNITELALSLLKETQYKERIKDGRLSAWIREQKEYNRDTPEITTTTLDDISENLPKYTPTQKLLILLRAIERKTDYPSAAVRIEPNFDYPIAWATNSAEFNYYVRALERRGFIQASEVGVPRTGSLCNIIIEPQGWDHLDKHSLEPAFMDQVFVAMSFSKNLKPVWKKGIEQAVREAGYEPYRIGEKPHLERIDAKIMTEIRNSRFLIANVTEQKQGVYFEAGFAMGLDRPVIWTVRKDDLKNVHFDTRQYNHIVWETPEELKDELYYFICGTIGKNK